MYRQIDKQVKQISIDLLNRGFSLEEISDLLCVSERSIYRWKATLSIFGNVVPPPLAPRGRPRTIPHEILDALHILMKESPSTYLQEIQLWLTVEHGITINISSIQRRLNAYGLTHKKLTTLAKERNDMKREEWIGFFRQYFVANHVLCTDESYKDERTSARRFGWSLRGEDAFELTPFVRGNRYSILPVLSVNGFLCTRVIEGSVDGAMFYDFVVNDVLPFMRPYPEPNSVLLLDNCAIHHYLDLEEVLNSVGCVLLFLPAYSPDLNPIEKSFHAIKAGLRREVHMDGEARDAVAEIEGQCARITPEMARGFYHSCGYRVV